MIEDSTIILQIIHSYYNNTKPPYSYLTFRKTYTDPSHLSQAMGISCITRNTYSILPLQLLLILIITPSSFSFTPTDNVTKETLNKLCSKSILYNRRFCVKWLTAHNRTTSMNIRGLMELAAEKAQAFGQENLDLMDLFAKISGNDKQFKNACLECVNGYGTAIKELEVAKDFLRNNSFQQAYNAAYKALDYAYVCKDQFEGPSNEPPFVLNRSVKFIEMCHIVRFFTSLFN